MLFLKQKISTKYKATTTEDAYSITITTVGWIDVFTRLNQKQIIIQALHYCQNQKGLEIYGYCIMHSHIHLLPDRADMPQSLAQFCKLCPQ